MKKLNYDKVCQVVALTRNQFVRILKSRGYKLREVAELWGITAPGLTQISKNPNRKPVWDFALWALPERRHLARVLGRRLQLARAIDASPTPSSRRSLRRQAPQTASSRIRESALVEIDDVWAVKDAQGEHLPEGCEGYVYLIQERNGFQHAAIRFTTGYEESFSVAYLTGPECFLVATGRTRTKA